MPASADPNETIINYYDTCEIDYRLFWDLGQSHAMHAGYWDGTTKTLRDALRRENQVLAEMAAIKAGDVVLDAGCGVGGSSLYLAGEIGCRTVGITLSEKQVQTATALAAERGLSGKCSFQAMDFTKMAFPDASFDVVWGIESFCHTQQKQAVINEASRVLKPGGRIVIADGFQLKRTLTDREHSQMGMWLQGWGCSSLETAEMFGSHLRNADFTDISFKDITPNVMPSSRRLYYISLPALVFSKVGEWLRLRSKVQTNNILAAYAQYKTLKDRVWHYGVFTAVKKGD